MHSAEVEVLASELKAMAVDVDKTRSDNLLTHLLNNGSKVSHSLAEGPTLLTVSESTVFLGSPPEYSPFPVKPKAPVNGKVRSMDGKVTWKEYEGELEKDTMEGLTQAQIDKLNYDEEAKEVRPWFVAALARKTFFMPHVAIPQIHSKVFTVDICHEVGIKQKHLFSAYTKKPLALDFKVFEALDIVDYIAFAINSSPEFVKNHMGLLTSDQLHTAIVEISDFDAKCNSPVPLTARFRTPASAGLSEDDLKTHDHNWRDLRMQHAKVLHVATPSLPPTANYIGKHVFRCKYDDINNAVFRRNAWSQLDVSRLKAQIEPYLTQDGLAYEIPALSPGAKSTNDWWLRTFSTQFEKIIGPMTEELIAKHPSQPDNPYYEKFGHMLFRDIHFVFTNNGDSEETMIATKVRILKPVADYLLEAVETKVAKGRAAMVNSAGFTLRVSDGKALAAWNKSGGKLSGAQDYLQMRIQYRVKFRQVVNKYMPMSQAMAYLEERPEFLWADGKDPKRQLPVEL